MGVGQKYLSSILEYSKETGSMFWKKRPDSMFKSKKRADYWNEKYSGKEAGSKYCNGSKMYKRIKINGVPFMFHHIVWIYNKGLTPKEIDHINGDGLDNRLSNLRDVTHAVNQKNKRKAKNNKSGYTGICRHRNKWLSYIYVNSKMIRLGSFVDICEAVKARKDAEIRYDFHENHGK